MRTVARWLFDWRNGVTIVVTALVVLLAITVSNGVEGQHRSQHTADLAIANQARASVAASRRIDSLTGEIQGLRAELDAVLAARSDAERAAAVRAADEERASTTLPPVPTTHPTATTMRTPATTTTTTTPATTAPQPPSTTTTAATCVTVGGLSACTRASRSRAAATSHVDPCGGWQALVASYPWPVGEACSVLWCESRGDPAARNGRYVGLFQVANGSTDVQRNVAQAFAMWSSRRWQPWSSCA